MVLIVFGLPGSGKSYFAKALAGKLGACYINSDTIRDSFHDHNRYSRQDRAAVYDMMLNKMLIAMHEGKTVIVDATFYKDVFRRRFTSYIREHGMLHFIEIVADEPVIKNRLQQRQDSHADFDVYKLVKRDWDPVQFPHLILKSTDDNLDEMISNTLNYLTPYQAKPNADNCHPLH